MKGYIEVVGIVKSVTQGTPNFIEVYFPNTKQKRKIECRFFCPAWQGDIFQGYCTEKDNGDLVLGVQPFVQPDSSDESIIKCIVMSTKIGYGTAKKMLAAIIGTAGSEGIRTMTNAIINNVSTSWNDTRSEELLDTIGYHDRDILKKFLEWWHKNKITRSLYLLGLTNKEIAGCKMPRQDIYEQCLVNPYTLPPIPIDKCDNIMYSRNINPTKIQRILGTMLRIIWDNQQLNSWTSTPMSYMAKKYTYFDDALKLLTKDYGVTIVDGKFLYIKATNDTENWVHNFIKLQVETDTFTEHKDEAVFKRDLSDDQKRAVNAALVHNISIITGGAGVGKTSCLAEIMENLDIKNIKYAVCSFTGKAVSVIREKTKKRNPCTIHRLIASVAIYGKLDHIIIDEASMLTTQLFADLIRSYPTVKRVTLIGDCNQLQPIEWGCIFEEIIKSKTVPTYVLSTNYRTLTQTGCKDGVIENANKIVKCTGPFEFSFTDNFSIIESSVEAVYTIAKSCQGMGIKPSDVQIITPYNTSIPEINTKCQQIFLPPNVDSIYDTTNTKWCVGDKVMLTKNDSEIGVYNGESGIVDSIDHVLKKIYVDFGNSGVHDFPLKIITGKYYKPPLFDGSEDLNEPRSVKNLVHSYCVTIDKSQGSEWPYVIYFIPYFNGSSFINKRRNYTAITRTKTAIWCVVPCVDSFMVSCTKLSRTRFDGLCKKLCSSLPTTAIVSQESANEFSMDNEFNNAYSDPDMPDFDDF